MELLQLKLSVNKYSEHHLDHHFNDAKINVTFRIMGYYVTLQTIAAIVI